MKNQMDWIVSGVFLLFAIIGVVIWMETKPIPQKPASAQTTDPTKMPAMPGVTVVMATSLPGGGGGGGGGKGSAPNAGEAKFGHALGQGGHGGGGPKPGGRHR